MPQKPLRPLRVRLLVAILLVSAFFSLIATLGELYFDYKRDLVSLDQRIQAIQQSHLPAISLAVWSIDSPLIETQMASLLSLPDIDAVQLTTKYGENFSIKSAQSNQSALRPYQFKLFNDTNRSFELGTLIVQSDINRIYQRLWDRVAVIFVAQGLRTLFVSIAILFIVQILVTRHLSKIADFFGRMRLSSLNQLLTLDRPTQKFTDEFDTIIESVNSMLQTFERDVRLMEDVRHTLRKSEEKYRLAVEATQDGLWDWDITTNEIYYSPAWVFLLGLHRVANRPETWFDRIHPEDLERVSLSIQRHLAGDTPVWQEEHRLRRQSGDWIWVLGRGQVIERTPQNQPLRMIGTITDIHASKENENLIWRQANYDALTNLPNRKLFQELLNQRLRSAERRQEPVWLLFIDLDGFKEVNDSFGHDAGDLLLQQVSQRITKLLRQADTVARLGGDEFVVIVTQSDDGADVDQVASKLIDQLCLPFDLKGHNANISASIGIACYPNDTREPEQLLKYADQSMYAAKQQGKNRYVYFTAAMQTAALLRRKLRNDICEALQQNQFQLYFQPVIDLSSGQLKKAEVLLRWQHPENGLLSPKAFLPIAEETGLMVELGAWVFRETCQHLQRWLAVNPSLQLAVNLSPLQLSRHQTNPSSFAETLAILENYGSHLIIEVTEKCLLDADNWVVERLHAYQRIGIQLAIDDFGTGYSALSQLNQFEFSYLKIDRNNIQRLQPGTTESAFTRAIIAMAHQLQLKIVAEGVETTAQREQLLDMGCDYAQGFLFAQPLDATHFEQQYLSQE